MMTFPITKEMNFCALDEAVEFGGVEPKGYLVDTLNETVRDLIDEITAEIKKANELPMSTFSVSISLRVE